MKKIFQFLRRWLPVAVWAGLVLYASTGAGSGIHTASLLKSIFAWFHLGFGLSSESLAAHNFFLRKSAHVVQFLIYALLVWRGLSLAPALEARPRWIAFWSMGSATVLAFASEGIQLFSPLRSPLFFDVLLDVSGAGAAILSALALRAIFGGRRNELLITRPAVTQ